MSQFKPTHTDIQPEVLRALMALLIVACCIPSKTTLGRRAADLFQGLDTDPLPDDDVLGEEYYIAALEWLAEQGRAAGLLPNKEQAP